MRSKIIFLLPFLTSLLKVSAHRATRIARILTPTNIVNFSKALRPLSAAHLENTRCFYEKILSIAQEAISFTQQEKQELLYLLSNGVDINGHFSSEYHDFDTAAGFAVHYNHLELLAFLLDQGAYAFTPGSTQSFAALALATGRIPLVQVLHKHHARLFTSEFQKFKIWEKYYPRFFLRDPEEAIALF